MFVVCNCAHGGIPLGQLSQKFEDSWEKPWDPLHERKKMYQEAYAFREKGDMKTYEQILQQAAQPISYRSHNGPKSELRSTGYFKAEYDWARLLEKKGNIAQALNFYVKSLGHSRYSIEDKARDVYFLAFGRVEEIWDESKKVDAENKEALVVLTRECFRGRNTETIERAFEYLERIETVIPQEERFALFKKYGWRSVVAAMDLLNAKQFAHRDGLALFHLAQLKQFGVCCDQSTTLASRYYINALKKAQPGDTYKGKAEQNLRHLAFADKRTIGSTGEYMDYVKSQKQWERYCAIGGSILDGCQGIIDKMDKEIEGKPGCRVVYHAGDNAWNIEYFERHYPELFVASELDDDISEELRFQLKLLEVRYLVLKAKEFRINQIKDPYTDTLVAYRAAVDGYKELASVSKKKYTDYNLKDLHGDFCMVAGAYAMGLFDGTSNQHLHNVALESALRFYSDARNIGYPAGLYACAMMSLRGEVGLTERQVRSYFNIMENNAPLVSDKHKAYFNLYEFYSGSMKLSSFVNLKDRDKKAKEYVKKAADEGSIPGMFAYGSLLLKSKDATKHVEGQSLVEKAAQKGSEKAIAYLKFQEIYDDVIRSDSDGKAALGNLRTFIKKLDEDIVSKLEKDALFIKLRSALTQKNKIFGGIVTASLQQRLNEIRK
jgi:TPR repeat protein